MISASEQSERRLAQVMIIGVCLLLVLAAAACSLGLVAFRQGAVGLPVFSVRVDHLELAAPCPKAFSCDTGQPYYSIWLGSDQPNGTTHFRQLYFTWLPKKHT